MNKARFSFALEAVANQFTYCCHRVGWPIFSFGKLYGNPMRIQCIQTIIPPASSLRSVIVEVSGIQHVNGI